MWEPLQALLTHDLVKEMLKSRLSAAEEDAEEGETCEPKLTRSKMKEVLEKGKVRSLLFFLSSVLFGYFTNGQSIMFISYAHDSTCLHHDHRGVCVCVMYVLTLMYSYM